MTSLLSYSNQKYLFAALFPALYAGSNKAPSQVFSDLSTKNRVLLAALGGLCFSTLAHFSVTYTGSNTHHFSLPTIKSCSRFERLYWGLNAVSLAFIHAYFSKQYEPSLFKSFELKKRILPLLLEEGANFSLLESHVGSSHTLFKSLLSALIDPTRKNFSLSFSRHSLSHMHTKVINAMLFEPDNSVLTALSSRVLSISMRYFIESLI